MTAALLVRICAWCRDYYAAEIVESRTADTIESHGACASCALALYVQQDAAEVRA